MLSLTKEFGIKPRDLEERIAAVHRWKLSERKPWLAKLRVLKDRASGQATFFGPLASVGPGETRETIEAELKRISDYAALYTKKANAVLGFVKLEIEETADEAQPMLTKLEEAAA